MVLICLHWRMQLTSFEKRLWLELIWERISLLGWRRQVQSWEMASRWTKPKMRQTKTSGNKPIFCLQLLRFIRDDYIGKLCFSSYLPFGGGPGKCIGDTFASFEVKTQLTPINTCYIWEYLLQMSYSNMNLCFVECGGGNCNAYSKI